MEMIGAASEGGRSFHHPIDDDEEGIEHGNAERKQHGGYLPSGIDAECPEEKAKKHRAGIPEHR